jgi:hypothetical protein
MKKENIESSNQLFPVRPFGRYWYGYLLPVRSFRIYQTINILTYSLVILLALAGTILPKIYGDLPLSGTTIIVLCFVIAAVGMTVKRRIASAGTKISAVEAEALLQKTSTYQFKTGFYDHAFSRLRRACTPSVGGGSAQYFL